MYIYPNLFQEWLIFGVEQLSPSKVSMFNTHIIPKDLFSLDHLHHYLHLNGHRSFFGHRARGPTGRARFGKESPCQFWIILVQILDPTVDGRNPCRIGFFSTPTRLLLDHLKFILHVACKEHPFRVTLVYKHGNFRQFHANMDTPSAKCQKWHVFFMYPHANYLTWSVLRNFLGN